jgi:hypothetical protein
MIVDFSQLPDMEPPSPYDTDEPPVITALALDPSGVVSAEDDVAASHDVYDDDWGYFMFSQSLNFEYTNIGRYAQEATFSINGRFTYNNEVGSDLIPSPSGEAHSDVAFNAMKDKYGALRYLLEAAAISGPPTAMADYATASDSRCVRLPDPLADENGDPVYARPTSLSINETIWPSHISYTAELTEVIQPSGVLTVESIDIHDATLTITPKSPRLVPQKFSFANAEELYFSGWNNRNFQVSGYIEDISPSGKISGTGITNFINELSSGVCNIGKRAPSPVTMWSNLYIDSSNVKIASNPTGAGTSISISMQV